MNVVNDWCISAIYVRRLIFFSLLLWLYSAIHRRVYVCVCANFVYCCCPFFSLNLWFAREAIYFLLHKQNHRYFALSIRPVLALHPLRFIHIYWNIHRNAMHMKKSSNDTAQNVNKPNDHLVCESRLLCYCIFSIAVCWIILFVCLCLVHDFRSRSAKIEYSKSSWSKAPNYGWEVKKKQPKRKHKTSNSLSERGKNKNGNQPRQQNVYAQRRARVATQIRNEVSLSQIVRRVFFVRQLSFTCRYACVLCFFFVLFVRFPFRSIFIFPFSIFVCNSNSRQFTLRL